MGKGIFDIASSCRIVYFNFNIMIIVVGVIVRIERRGEKSSSQLCTHINSDDNKAMMGAFAFYVLKEKNHNKKEEQ